MKQETSKVLKQIIIYSSANKYELFHMIHVHSKTSQRTRLIKEVEVSHCKITEEAALVCPDLLYLKDLKIIKKTHYRKKTSTICQAFHKKYHGTFISLCFMWGQVMNLAYCKKRGCVISGIVLYSDQYSIYISLWHKVFNTWFRLFYVAQQQYVISGY